MTYSRYVPVGGGGGGGGSGTVTQVNTGTGLTGGPITTTGTVALANTAVTPSTYGDATHVGQFTVDQQGRLTNAANVAITYPAPTSGNLTDAGTDGIVVTGGTGAVLGSGTSLAQHVADSTHNGYLSSTDWSTFNGKQASGNYITALTTDVTATGPGSVAATIAVGAVTDTKGSLANKPAVTVVATTNQALTGTPTIDGQATAAGSLILLTAQSTGSQNGPWVAAAGAWSRPTWYPSGGTTQAFQFITTLVRLGTVYGGSTWRQTAAAPITIDTTATTWVVTKIALSSSTTTGPLLTSAIGITIDGAGSPITTGNKGYLYCPFACTITAATMLADQTGSIVIDIWKIAYASFPPLVGNSITSATPPTITSAQKSQDNTLSSWVVSVAAGDTFAFNVNSCSAITRVNLVLTVSRT